MSVIKERGIYMNKKNKELQIKRNELHFHIQRKFRMNIVESKKIYNRKRLPKISY